MTELFHAVRPRDDVLQGALSDAIFAASLDQVVSGTAPPVYGDPKTFFAGTHPSAGLKSLLNEAMGRLSGTDPDSSPLIRLETNLGGGKTHNLIALLHAARGDLPAAEAAEFIESSRLPAKPIDQVGVFVGTETGATSFPAVSGIQPQTLWGYLALQVGGASGYELVRQDDENLSAPGAKALSEVMGDAPTLFLIDEIARYLAVAEARAVGGNNLAEQTTAFLMALIESVAAKANACLVITTTQVTDAFGDQTEKVLSLMADAQALVARREHVIRPSEEADLPKILARRLFAEVDESIAPDVAAAYAQAAKDGFGRGADLPERMMTATFAADIANDYPFHPDLLDVLDKRLSTIPNFQRTRGALRLLARAVRLLWEARPAGTQLVHLHHIDLSDSGTAEDLSSRLGKPTFEPVIRADIASQQGGDASHAEVVDERLGGSFASQLATAAYLFSLTHDVPGVPASTLLGSVLSPGDDPNLLTKALDELEASAWYLHVDVRGYRFSVEPSLVKLIQEHEAQVTPGRARQAATDILAGLFKDSALKVKRVWEDSRVADRADDAPLVVFHWDDFGSNLGVTDLGTVPEQIENIWTNAPAGGIREFKNRLVFLAPSGATHDQMVRTIRRHLALKDLSTNSDVLRALPDEKRKELADRAKESELEARIAVCNHLNLLFVPKAGGLEAIELDVATQASVKRNQTDAVLDRLAAMEKTLATGDKPLDPAWIKSQLGAQLDSQIATEELLRIFARRPDMKLVLDQNQIRELIIAGIRNGVWEYQDPERGADGWATASRPVIPVRIGVDTYLHPVGAAPAPETPGGGEIIKLPPIDELTVGSEFTAEGAAGVAFATARSDAADKKREQVREIRVSIDELGTGTGTEFARLLSVLPATTPRATVSYRVSASIQFGQERMIRLDFQGLANDFQPLRSPLEHLLGQNEAVLKASVSATFTDPLELSGQDVETIRERATSTGPSRCEVVLVTEGT